MCFSKKINISCPFPRRTRKERKEAASLRLDRLCGRQLCACGRELSSRTCFSHGEWWPVRALRALQHLSSRGYVLPSSRMRVRDTVSATLFVVFSSVRKRHFFFFGKERTHAFLYRKKSIKRTASLRLDRLCGRQRFGGGYERRRPRSRSSRDPSTAAPFGDIVPEGAHAARALRLRAQASHSQLRPARGVVACASPASTATPFEPCVCASQ